MGLFLIRGRVVGLILGGVSKQGKADLPQWPPYLWTGRFRL